MRTLILAKAAAARANVELAQLDAAMGEAIAGACQQLLDGDCMAHFPVDVFQTGSGTSSNMNANEVVATLASRLLADRAIASFTVNEAKLREALARNSILVTALNPIIGYLKAAEIAKRAYREGRPVIDVAEEDTDLGRAELERLLDPEKLTAGGL